MKKIFAFVFAAVAGFSARAEYSPGYDGNAGSNPRTGGQFVQGPNGPVMVGVAPSGFEAGRAAATTNTYEIPIAPTTSSSEDAAASENNLTGNTDSIEDQAANEIKARYEMSRNKARQACPVVIDKINAIKVSAGINVATGVIGTAGGVTAAVTGFMKSSQDSQRTFGWGAEIKDAGDKYAKDEALKVGSAEWVEGLLKVGEVEEGGKIKSVIVDGEKLKNLELAKATASGTTAAKIDLVCDGETINTIIKDAGDKYAKDEALKVGSAEWVEGLLKVGEVEEGGKIKSVIVDGEKLKNLELAKATASGTTAAKIGFGCLPGENNKDTSGLGTARTVGSFVAGGSNVVGATSVFIGLGQFDEATKLIELCNSAIAEIDKQATELSFAKPDDRRVDEMRSVVAACKGLDKKNIEDIKGKLTASGVISAIGAATGIAGGVTSVMSNKNTATGVVESDNLGTASNVLAVATTAASLTSTIFSGVTLAGLNKNGKIAESCKAQFGGDGIR